MALRVELGCLLSAFAAAILGADRAMILCRAKKAVRFISFQQIDSQTLHVAVPFRDRLLNQNHSNHLGY